MAGQIKVTSEELHQTAAQVRATGEQINAQLTQMLGRVQNLVAGGWIGDASASFNAFYTEANTGWKQVQTAMEGMSTMISNAATAYESNEAAIAGQFKG